MRPSWRVVPVLLALTVGAAYAQEPIPIEVGGMTVARIRAKGNYESLAARASQVEKWIADVISYENTNNPKLSLARKNGVLHVYCAKRPVIDVYPADAAAGNTTEMALAQMWLKNLKEALPRATPVIRLPARPPKPGEAPPVPPQTGSVRPASGVTPTGPATGLSGQAPGASTEPTGEIVPKAEETALPTPSKTPRSSALLMVLTTMNLVRELPEAEYLEGRDRIAANLLENLEPFMAEARTAGEAAGEPQPPRPSLIETPPPTPPKPETAESPAGSVPRVPTVPTVPKVPAAPTVPSAPSSASVTPVPPTPTTGDPTRARVPQKQRIKRKFAAAQDPFMALKNAGDPKADEVAQLLKESRDAYTAEDFDTAETKVNEALSLMGVPIPN